MGGGHCIPKRGVRACVFCASGCHPILNPTASGALADPRIHLPSTPTSLAREIRARVTPPPLPHLTTTAHLPSCSGP